MDSPNHILLNVLPRDRRSRLRRFMDDMRSQQAVLPTPVFATRMASTRVASTVLTIIGRLANFPPLDRPSLDDGLIDPIDRAWPRVVRCPGKR
jgi:hypothetical protein